MHDLSVKLRNRRHVLTSDVSAQVPRNLYQAMVSDQRLLSYLQTTCLLRVRSTVGLASDLAQAIEPNPDPPDGRRGPRLQRGRRCVVFTASLKRTTTSTLANSLEEQR